ncbi:MAG TPA: cytidine deaminase [Clostridiales bacterium]|jgi:cytidine deaminase|nr:cytidine deaminase [Clostridiales bacterium]
MRGEDTVKNSLIRREKGELIGKQEVVSRSVVKNLIREAIEASKHSYSPYSNFCVGAALLTTNQKVYTGCNIENVAYSPTNCAERTAFFKAISEGDRNFAAIAIVGGKAGALTDYCPPCGVCRQVIREFVDPEKFLVILAKSEDDYLLYFLEELLPLSFGPEHI